MKDDTEALRKILRSLGITEYWIWQPHPPGSAGLIYGVWFKFRKLHESAQ